MKSHVDKNSNLLLNNNNHFGICCLEIGICLSADRFKKLGLTGFDREVDRLVSMSSDDIIAR